MLNFLESDSNNSYHYDYWYSYSDPKIQIISFTKRQVYQQEFDFWIILISYVDICQELYTTGLIFGLHPANERRRYKVTPPLIGWKQT